MADLRLHSALGSDLRRRILEVLSEGERSVLELARQLRIHPMTVRYHLSVLLALDLVHEVGLTARKRAGRPARLYRATARAASFGYPQRRFDLLAQVALETFTEVAGAEAAARSLRERGTTFGASLVRQIAAEAGVTAWTPEAFERLVLHGLMADLGQVVEVVERSPERITYLCLTCPFLELARRMPGLVCDAMDDGFHRGIDEAVPGAHTEKLACMGWGDPRCEYRMTWSKGPQKRRRRKEVDA